MKHTHSKYKSMVCKAFLLYYQKKKEAVCDHKEKTISAPGFFFNHYKENPRLNQTRQSALELKTENKHLKHQKNLKQTL